MRKIPPKLLVFTTLAISLEFVISCSEAPLIAVAGADEFVKRAYGPEQMVGPPDAPTTSDSSRAWCPATASAKGEWIELEFDTAVVPDTVIVYANYTPGAVAKVIGFTESDMRAELWSGKDPHKNEDGRFISRIKTGGVVTTKKLRIELRCDEVGSWNEIDTVGIQDEKGKVHWPIAARASSSYATGAGKVAEMPEPIKVAKHARVALPIPAAAPSVAYSAAQATGKPNAPEAGDSSKAWASATADGQNEWLELEYAKAIEPVAIIVHENSAPGALAAVSALVEGKEPVVIWEGEDPTPREEASGISTVKATVAVKTKRIRLSIKSKDVPGWNEIDAVGIRDKAGVVHWAKDATASSVWGGGVLERGFIVPLPMDDVPVAVDPPEFEVKPAEIPEDADPFRHEALLRMKVKFDALVKHELRLAEQLKEIRKARTELLKQIETLEAAKDAP